MIQANGNGNPRDANQPDPSRHELPPPEAGNRYSLHLNAEGQIVAFDVRLEEASGYPSAELVGKHFVDLLHREDIASAVSLFGTTLARGEGALSP